MTPQVSVLMATHNDGAYLAPAIDSILCQSFTDFEFIIVDDGSLDDTPAVLSCYDDPRIIQIRHETNLKLAKSLNEALFVARGKYVARMDGDDVSLPVRLQYQVAFMDAHPEIGILGTQSYDLDPASRIVGRSAQPLTHGLIIWTYLSRLAYPLCHPTICARRDLLVENGGYNTDFPREQDGELFLRLAHATRYANLPDYFYIKRLSPSSDARRELFRVSFQRTLEIRRKCIARFIQREVDITELHGLIFPTKRSHREDCGIELTLPVVKRGIRLLIEIFRALDGNGYFNAQEREAAEAELGDLIAEKLSYCEEYYVDSFGHLSLNSLMRPPMRRLSALLLHPGNTLGVLWQKLTQTMSHTG